MAFANPADGWVVGDNGIYATTNGGATWKVRYRDSQSLGLEGVAFASASHGWAVGAISDPNSLTYKFEGSTILTTNDGGVTWKH